MPVSDEYKGEISETDGTNIRNVKCKYCGSIILLPSSARYYTFEYNLPLMQQRKSSSAETEVETVSCFWLVEEMYSFHNVGFSNTVGETKYLICADCDAGPVGYHDLSDRISYVALSRVVHE